MRLRLIALAPLALLALTACIEDSTPSNESEADAAPGSADALVDGALPDVAVDAEPPPGPMIDAGAEPDAAPPTPCEGDDDCPAGATCLDEGVCSQPECAGDADCGGGMLQACYEGACVDRCLGPNTCFRGGVCENNICVPPECAEDAECAEGELCRGGSCVEAMPCDDDAACEADFRCVEGNCEPLPPCAGDRNCAAGEICQDGLCRERPACEARDDCAGAEDCVGGVCVPFVCRGDADCDPGLVCDGGGCVEPAMPEVAEVVVLTRPRTVVVGQQVAYRAVALDLRGDIVATRGFVWAVEPEAAAGFEGAILTAGPQLGEATVRAGFEVDGEVIWSEPVGLRVVDSAPPEQGIRVRVTDAATGAPLEGATVRADDAEAATDAEGIATFDAAADVVSVFAADHDYVTLVGVAGDDLHVALPPRSDDALVAGFTGEVDFARVTTEGGVDLGLAGASISGGLTHVNFGVLLGQLFNVPVNAGPVSFDLPLPGGLVLSAELPIIGRVNLKDDYRALSGAGFRLAWSFAGRIDVNALLGLVGGGGGGFDAGQVLTTLLPFFDRFQHGLRVADDLVALPTRVDDTDVDNDGDTAERVPDYERFPVLNVAPAQDQRLRVAVEVPALADGQIAIVFAGVEVDEVGFVPLGLSAADEASTIPMRMAPPYGGLQGGERTLMALAADFGGGGGFSLPDDLSVLFARFGDSVPADAAFAGGFLPTPAGFEWDVQLRTLRVGDAEGAELYRAVIEGAGGRWLVYLGPGADEVVLPFPGEGIADLAAGGQARFEAFRLRAGATFDALVGLGGPGDLPDFDRFVDAFSRAVD